MYGMRPPSMGYGNMGGGMSAPQFRFGQGMQPPPVVQPPAIQMQGNQQAQSSQPFGSLSPEMLAGLKALRGGAPGTPGATGPMDITPQGFGAGNIGAGAVGRASGMGMPQPPAMPDPVTQMPDPRMGLGAVGTGSGVNGANYGLLNRWLMPPVPTSGNQMMPMVSGLFF